MSGTLRLKGSTSGYSELQAPAVAGDQTFILPAAGGTLLTTDSPAPTLTLESGTVTSPSLRFEGDLNTGIYSPGANVLAITTGGSQRLFVGSTGNIGIGTNNPTETLTVDGNIEFESNTQSLKFAAGNSAVNSIEVNSGSGPRASIDFLGVGTAQITDIVFKTPETSSTSAERMRIKTTTGEVGIGTSSPDQKLEVKGNILASADAGTDVSLRVNEGTTSAAFVMEQTATENTIESGAAIPMRIGTTGNETLALKVNDTNRLLIANGGNVGIGTDSPFGKLHVQDDTNNLEMFLIGPSTGSTRIRFGDNADTNIGQVIYDNTNDSLQIHTNNSERMRIDSSGNVGIGTSSPQEKLHVREGDIIIGQASGATTGIRNYIKFGRDGAPKAAIGFLNDSANGRGDLLFMNDSVSDADEFSDADEVMRITSNGNVGIGTDSPDVKLHVDEGSSTPANDTPEIKITAFRPAIRFLDRSTSANSAEICGDDALIFRCSVPVDDNTALTEHMRIKADGNVGIGTSSPTAPLQVVNNDNAPGGTIQTWSADTGTNTRSVSLIAPDTDSITEPFTFFTNNAWNFRIDATDALTIDASANVGIGTTTPNRDLDIEAATPRIRFTDTDTALSDDEISSGIEFYQSDASGPGIGASIVTRGDGSTGRLQLCFNADNNVERMRIQANGNVGIGTTSPGAKLDVNGSLSKNSGSFKIDHPLPALTETHHLVHSFVEAPDASNLYAGMVDLVDGTATVNIDTAHRMTEGTFEALNILQSWASSNESGYAPVKCSMSGNILTIECQDPTSTDTVYYEVRGIRKDQHMLDTEWTDSNGKVITEPLKPVSSEVA